MNLEYLTDEQIQDYTDRAEEATLASPGWSMSLTEAMRFELQQLGIQDIPQGIFQMYKEFSQERKERAF